MLLNRKPTADPIVVWDGPNVKSITIPRPSNFHAHLRADELMRAIAYDIMHWVKYLLVMPNTGPIDTVAKIKAYHAQLVEVAESLGIPVPELIMTIYYTDKLTPAVINELAKLPFKVAVKYYPPHKGATTGSGLGIPLSEGDEVFKEMTNVGMHFLGHFESVYDKDGREIPMPQREGYFMDHEFMPFRERHPDLQTNIEHASTAKAVRIVKADTSGKTTCGFTPHHLFITIDMLNGVSWKNHGRCMPIPKGPEDVAECLAFATSGDYRAHLGDDTAAHLSKNKENMPFDEAACGCWLPHSIAMYAFAFMQAKALDRRFVQFACHNGPDLWGLERPDPNDTITLVADNENDIPDPLPVEGTGDVVIPLGYAKPEDGDRLRIGLVQHIMEEAA